MDHKVAREDGDGWEEKSEMRSENRGTTRVAVILNMCSLLSPGRGKEQKTASNHLCLFD